MGIGYTIISKPSYIIFRCPYCRRDVSVQFRQVKYNTELWDDGAACVCPECNKEVELDGYKYD